MFNDIYIECSISSGTMDSTPPSSSPSTQKSPKKAISWHGLRGNIPKYYLAMFFRNLWISMPIGILYYMDRGLNFVQMAIIEVVIAAIIMVTDIPSGALADIFRRTLSQPIGYWPSLIRYTRFFPNERLCPFTFNQVFKQYHLALFLPHYTDR